MGISFQPTLKDDKHLWTDAPLTATMNTGQKQRIQLDGAVEIELPDGSLYEVRPGPYRKGVAVVAISNKTDDARSPGRQPRAGTVKLRDKLARDAAAGRLHDAPFYYRWILKEDDTISQAVARQVVYRELKRAQP